MLLFNKYELIGAFTQVVDMVNTNLANHHQRTAYLADQLCRRLDFNKEDHQAVIMSALMHDVGVIPLRIKVDDLLYENDLDLHSWSGWMMLRDCPVFAREAALIRYHHSSWANIKNLAYDKFTKAKLANVVNLADHLDIVSRSGKKPKEVARDLKKETGFAPFYLAAAADLLIDADIFNDLGERAKKMELPQSMDLSISMEDMVIFADVFAALIDSRSPFTASHSRSVANIALYLHKLAGLPKEDAVNIFMAGLLHDIGKMAVPVELIEKRGRLTSREYELVCTHAAVSWQTLSHLPGFHKVAAWGALHHERLDGSGYPFGLSGKALPAEARIMAVADVLAALTEDRPYRLGFRPEAAAGIMQNMARSKALDEDLVSLACKNIDQFSLQLRDLSASTGKVLNDTSLEGIKEFGHRGQKNAGVPRGLGCDPRAIGADAYAQAAMA